MSSLQFYPNVFTEQSWCDRTGGCGGLCLCNKSTSTMWLGYAPLTLREKSDTRHQSKNMQLNSWTTPLASSLAAIIKPPSPGGGRLTHRQPVSGGSPIAFVHFSPSFLAEPLLPRGLVRPVPVWLRLDSSEAAEMESLEVDANDFPQPEHHAFHSWAKQLVFTVNYVAFKKQWKTF